MCALDDGGEIGVIDLCEFADFFIVGGDLARLNGFIDDKLNLFAVLVPHCSIRDIFNLGILVETSERLFWIEGVLLLDYFHRLF